MDIWRSARHTRRIRNEKDGRVGKLEGHFNLLLFTNVRIRFEESSTMSFFVAMKKTIFLADNFGTRDPVDKAWHLRSTSYTTVKKSIVPMKIMRKIYSRKRLYVDVKYRHGIYTVLAWGNFNISFIQLNSRFKWKNFPWFMQIVADESWPQKIMGSSNFLS